MSKIVGYSISDLCTVEIRQQEVELKNSQRYEDQEKKQSRPHHHRGNTRAIRHRRQELVKECLDMLTEGMSQDERETYIDWYGIILAIHIRESQ